MKTTKMLYFTLVILAITCCALSTPIWKREIVISEKGVMNFTIGRDSLPDYPQEVSEEVEKNVKAIFNADTTTSKTPSTTDYKIIFFDHENYETSSVHDQKITRSPNEISNEVFEFPEDNSWQTSVLYPKHSQNDGSSYKILMPDFDFNRDDLSVYTSTESTLPSNLPNLCQLYCHRKITGEYNPICGSDGVTYTNPGKFSCAQLCRRRVRKIGHFSCGDLAPIV